MPDIPIRIPTSVAKKDSRAIIQELRAIAKVAQETANSVKQVAQFQPKGGMGMGNMDRVLNRFLGDMQRVLKQSNESVGLALNEQERLVNRAQSKILKDAAKQAEDMKSVARKTRNTGKTHAKAILEDVKRTEDKRLAIHKQSGEKIMKEYQEQGSRRQIQQKRDLELNKKSNEQRQMGIKKAAEAEKSRMKILQTVANQENRIRDRRIKEQKADQNRSIAQQKAAGARMVAEARKINKDLDRVRGRFGGGAGRFAGAKSQIGALRGAGAIGSSEAARLTAGAEAKFNKASASVAKLGKGMRGLSQQFTQFGQVAAIALGPLSGVAARISTINALSATLTIGLAMATAGFIAFAFAIGKSIGAAAAFEKGMIGVQKTTNISTRDLKKLGSTLLSLSSEIGVSNTKLALIAKTAGQMGVRGVANLTKFTKTVAILTETTDLSAEQAAMKMSRLLNITKESVGSVDVLGSVIVSLGNNFAATEVQIVDYSIDVARAGAIFDITAAQSVALGTALAAAGVKSEAGGTAVGRVMRAIKQLLREGGVGFQQFARLTGKSTTELTKIIKTDMMGAFKLVIEGLARVKAGGNDASLALEVFGLRGSREQKAILPFVKNVDLLRRAFSLMNSELENPTAAANEFARVMESLSFRTNQMVISANNFITKIGTDMIPAIKPFVSALSYMINLMSQYVIIIEAMTLATGIWIHLMAKSMFGRIIGGLIAVVGAVTTLTRAFGGIEQGINDANDALKEHLDLLDRRQKFGLGMGLSLKIGWSRSIIKKVRDEIAGIEQSIIESPSINDLSTRISGISYSTSINRIEYLRASIQGLIKNVDVAQAKLDDIMGKGKDSGDTVSAGLTKQSLDALKKIVELRQKLSDLESGKSVGKEAVALAADAAKARAILSSITSGELEYFAEKSELAGKSVKELVKALALLITKVRHEQKALKDAEISQNKIIKARAKATKELASAKEGLETRIIQLHREADATNLSARERFITLGIMREENILRRTGHMYLLDELGARERLRKALDRSYNSAKALRVATSEAKKEAKVASNVLKEPFLNAIRAIQSSFSDMFVDIFDGGLNSARDFGQRLIQIFKRMAAEIAAVMIIRPILGGIINGIGLGNLIGGSGGGAGFGGFNLSSLGSVGGGISGLKTLFSGGPLGGLSGLGGFGMSLSNFGSGFMSGGSLFSTPTAGFGSIGNEFTTGAGGAQGAAFSFGNAAANIGAGIAGHFTANAFLAGGRSDSQNTNAGLGSTVGGFLGAATGTGPLGVFVGSAIGNFVGGLFGGKNGGSKISEQLSAQVEADSGAFFQAIGLPNSREAAIRTRNLGRNLGESGQPDLGGLSFQAFGIRKEVINAFGDLAGAVNRIDFTNLAQAASDVNFARTFLATDFEAQFNPVEITAVATALKNVNDQFEAVNDIALRLGLNVEELTASRDRALSLLKTGFEEEIETAVNSVLDPFNQALDALTEAHESRRDDANLLGASTTKLVELEKLELDAILKGREDFILGVSKSILAIEDPGALAIQDFDRLAEARLDQAKQFGIDLTEVERLNGLERQKVLEDSVKAQVDSLKSAILELTEGGLSPLSAPARLALIQARFDELKASASASDPDSISNLAQASTDLVAIARENFASSSQFFTIFNEVLAVLKNVGSSLPGFASGGSFTVGGFGGTDSQLVAFRATPGESISVGEGQNENGREVARGNIVNDQNMQDIKTILVEVRDVLERIERLEQRQTSEV